MERNSFMKRVLSIIRREINNDSDVSNVAQLVFGKVTPTYQIRSNILIQTFYDHLYYVDIISVRLEFSLMLLINNISDNLRVLSNICRYFICGYTGDSQVISIWYNYYIWPPVWFSGMFQVSLVRRHYLYYTHTHTYIHIYIYIYCLLYDDLYPAMPHVSCRASMLIYSINKQGFYTQYNGDHMMCRDFRYKDQTFSSW